MKKINSTLGSIIAALAIMGIAGSVADGQITNIIENIKPVFGSGSSGSCPGTYHAYAKMTNSAGSIWLTPPAHATNGVFTDISGSITVSVDCNGAPTKRSNELV
jgi:hypothetical protein